MNAVKIFSTLVLIAILSACGSADEDTLVINWVAPIQREDGTALILSDIETYKLYYGSSPGNYQYSINDIYVTSDSMHITGFPRGTYYFVITTVTTEGLESRWSDEIEIII